MSTKIYNGYRIKDGQNWKLGDVINHITEWYTLNALPLIKCEVARHKANLACTYIDSIYFPRFDPPELPTGKEIKGDESPLLVVNSDVDDRILDEMDYRHCKVSSTDLIDIAIEIGFTQISNGEILLFVCLPSFNENELKKSIAEQYWIEYFGYWNNTSEIDPNCSEEEWDYRRRCWEEAFPGDSAIPASNMLFFSPAVAMDVAIHSLQREYLEFVASHVSPPEKRARQIAENIVFQNYISDTNEEEFRDFMRLFTWIKDEGKEEVESVKQEVLPYLPEVDSKLLTTPFKDIREHVKITSSFNK